MNGQRLTASPTLPLILHHKTRRFRIATRGLGVPDVCGACAQADSRAKKCREIKKKFEAAAERDDKRTKMVTLSSSSPYHQHSSPYSLSFLLEQHHNQCVPSSPSLSPFFRQHGALTQKVAPSRAGNSPAAAQVPELILQGENTGNTASNSGSRGVYSGSPLLRQILRGQLKPHTGDVL